jgi:DNA-binding NarL/FixJ family response regulator
VLAPTLPAWYTGKKEISGMAQVVAFVDDLFFQSKLFETAKQVGVELRTCTTPDVLAEEIARSIPRLVVVDLNAHANPLEAVERVHATGHEIPLIGFLSHVQAELAERARAAGFRNVMPRSKFTQNLATILAEAKSETS